MMILKAYYRVSERIIPETYFLGTDLPQIDTSDSNMEKIKKLERLVKDFRKTIKRALTPIACCKGKRYACLCLWRNIFGTLEQMKIMLEINFDSR